MGKREYKYRRPPDGVTYAEVGGTVFVPECRLIDVEGPYVREFDLPDRGPRRVEVNVRRYEVGVHFWATVREQDNRLVVVASDEKRPILLSIYGDVGNAPLSFTGEFDSEGDAVAFIAGKIREHFGGPEHQVLTGGERLLRRLERAGVSGAKTKLDWLGE